MNWCAETAGLILLDYDHDFETIESVTVQPVEWVVEAARFIGRRSAKLPTRLLVQSKATRA
jgi:hypothetical protein